MNEEQLRKLKELADAAVERIKREAIKEKGAVDFHFQVPNFDSPLSMIPAILNEIRQFAEAMEEYKQQKSEEASEEEKPRLEAESGMWEVWNGWNAIIGMVMSSDNPNLMNRFHETMVQFVQMELQNGEFFLIKRKKEKDN